MVEGTDVMNTINRFDFFLDKVSSIVLDILSNEADEMNDEWGIAPTMLTHSWSVEEDWINEQEKVFAEFLESLTPAEYHSYFAEQEEARNVYWELEMAS
jgi:hypothetical protein